MNQLFIAPHNDDEALFGSYTLLREKPLVLLVTDSWIQGLRGTGITASQRRRESIEACKILGVDVAFLGIKDHEITSSHIKAAMAPYFHFEKVFIPAKQGGHQHHDMINEVFFELWPQSSLIQYATYQKEQSFTPVGKAVVPTETEFKLKIKALNCYKSQVNYEPTRHHFDAVIAHRHEYLL